MVKINWFHKRNVAVTSKKSELLWNTSSSISSSNLLILFVNSKSMCRRSLRASSKIYLTEMISGGRILEKNLLITVQFKVRFEGKISWIYFTPYNSLHLLWHLDQSLSPRTTHSCDNHVAYGPIVYSDCRKFQHIPLNY